MSLLNLSFELTAHEEDRGPREQTPAVQAKKGDGKESGGIGQTTRSLLDLPAEIWLKIGKYAIELESDFDLRLTLGAAVVNPQAAKRPHQPGITRVCRCLRHELLPIFYATKVDLYINERFVYKEHLMKAAGRWLRAIGGENRRLLKGVEYYGEPEAMRVFVACAKKEDWFVPFVCEAKEGANDYDRKRSGDEKRYSVRFL